MATVHSVIVLKFVQMLVPLLKNTGDSHQQIEFSLQSRPLTTLVPTSTYHPARHWYLPFPKHTALADTTDPWLMLFPLSRRLSPTPHRGRPGACSPVVRGSGPKPCSSHSPALSLVVSFLTTTQNVPDQGGVVCLTVNCHASTASGYTAVP